MVKPMAKRKQEIITFKADGSLLEAMKGIPNRSEFIRTAVLTALESACPVCGGTGILTPDQRKHWKAFAANHSLRQCDECSEFHLVCTNNPASGPHQQEMGE